MCKFRQIPHKLYIRPLGITQFVSDSPSIKSTKIKLIPIIYMFKKVI